MPMLDSAGQWLGSHSNSLLNAHTMPTPLLPPKAEVCWLCWGRDGQISQEEYGALLEKFKEQWAQEEAEEAAGEAAGEATGEAAEPQAA